MSQIDVRNAKLALAARLRDWEVKGDAAFLAGGFIDDLVARGWQMAPFRETRPFPPLVGECCSTCGKSEEDCRRNPHGDHLFKSAAELKGHIQPAPKETA